MPMNEQMIAQRIESLLDLASDLSANYAGNIFCRCSCCGRAIHYGNACLDIVCLVEQICDEQGRLVCKVNNDISLARLCATCSNRYAYAEWVGIQFIDQLELPNQRPQEVYFGPHCSMCGCGLPVGTLRMDLGIRISQVDWDESMNDSVITTIQHQTMHYFCAKCGGHLLDGKLREAVHHILVTSNKH